MIISKIELFNWKNFHRCEVGVQERCFVVGANAAGKSNFIDALRFLRDVAKQGGGLQTAVRVRGGITKILIPFDNADDLEDVAAEVKDKLKITPVKKVSDVLKLLLG